MHNLSLIICDDESASALRTEQLSIVFFESQNISYDITVYSDGQQMIADIADELIAPDMIFMDIELEDAPCNGIELARRLNLQDYPGYIVFLTNHANYISDVYQTEHFYMILKQDLATQLPRLFDRVSELEASRDKKICVTYNRHTVSLHTNEIVYIERHIRVTDFVTGESRYPSHYSMDELPEKLGSDCFVRVHNSYIVNLRYMKRYKRDCIVMDLDPPVEIPVSRRYQPDLKKEVMAWAAHQSMLDL